MRLLVTFAVLALTAATADADVLRVPSDHATIQEAVDAASDGDSILVGPGDHCGAEITAEVRLIGIGATIVGCEAPVLVGELRVGFLLPDDRASGTSIRGFRFEGRGVSNDNTDPLAFGVFARDAHGVVVAYNRIRGTVQGITNTRGDGWTIRSNRITELTLFECPGYCGGGSGIVIQARDLDGERAYDNAVLFNRVRGAIPDGHDAFSMDGIFVAGQQEPKIIGNKLRIPANDTAAAPGVGIEVASECCGGTPILDSTDVVAARNDGKHSEFVLIVDTGNADGGFFWKNRGVSVIEGVVTSYP
jgi:nitrous oxidase accessory protein NosD